FVYAYLSSFSLANASAIGLLNGSSSCLFCFFMNLATSVLDTFLFFCLSRRCWNADSFSR
ncbi:conserved hypothetical protein, partial [Listeria marthii FSL S4-120]